MQMQTHVKIQAICIIGICVLFGLIIGQLFQTISHVKFSELGVDVS